MVMIRLSARLATLFLERASSRFCGAPPASPPVLAHTACDNDDGNDRQQREVYDGQTSPDPGPDPAGRRRAVTIDQGERCR
jgi:hypothetical protein